MQEALAQVAPVPACRTPSQKVSAGSVRAGVSQVLNRLTFTSSLSHLRRMNTPVGREGKLAKPRQLHNTHAEP